MDKHWIGVNNMNDNLRELNIENINRLIREYTLEIKCREQLIEFYELKVKEYKDLKQFYYELLYKDKEEIVKTQVSIQYLLEELNKLVDIHKGKV